jgi:hypothetical protein
MNNDFWVYVLRGLHDINLWYLVIPAIILLLSMICGSETIHKLYRRLVDRQK